MQYNYHLLQSPSISKPVPEYGYWIRYTIRTILLVIAIMSLTQAASFAQGPTCCELVTFSLQSLGGCDWNISVQPSGGPESGCPPLVQMKIEDVGYSATPVKAFQPNTPMTGQAPGSGMFIITVYDMYGNPCVKQIPYSCEEEAEPTPYSCDNTECPTSHQPLETVRISIPNTGCQADITYRRAPCNDGSVALKIEGIKIIPAGCSMPYTDEELVSVIMVTILKGQELSVSPYSSQFDIQWKITIPSCLTRNTVTGQLEECENSSCCQRMVHTWLSMDCNTNTGTRYLEDVYHEPGSFEAESGCPHPKKGFVRDYEDIIRRTSP
jgi:hypothetical protein